MSASSSLVAVVREQIHDLTAINARLENIRATIESRETDRDSIVEIVAAKDYVTAAIETLTGIGGQY